jgi:hypothetical protein
MTKRALSDWVFELEEKIEHLEIISKAGRAYTMRLENAVEGIRKYITSAHKDADFDKAIADLDRAMSQEISFDEVDDLIPDEIGENS